MSRLSRKNYASRRVLTAVFEREEDLLGAVKASRAEGLCVADAFSPYPVHGLDEAMGLKPSRIPIVCLVAGLVGLAVGLTLQVWTSAFSWPLNVGGKPLNSMPAFVPVAFELVILFAGLASVAAFLLRGGRSGLAPAVAERLADDRFALVILAEGAAYDGAAIGRRLSEEHGAVEVTERLEEEPR